LNSIKWKRSNVTDFESAKWVCEFKVGFSTGVNGLAFGVPRGL